MRNLFACLFSLFMMLSFTGQLSTGGLGADASKKSAFRTIERTHFTYTTHTRVTRMAVSKLVTICTTDSLNFMTRASDTST
jgi:hypothetical protein